METSSTGRTIYPKIGVWYRADTGHIHLSIEGEGFSTVNCDPASVRGHPHLFNKLAEMLRAAGAEAPLVSADRSKGPEDLARQLVETKPSARQYAGRYGPLRAHLETCGKDRITMTFGQIEQLVGKLPKSASLHLAWWGNHEGNSQAKAWMGAKYLVEANPAGRSVIFRKFSY